MIVIAVVMVAKQRETVANVSLAVASNPSIIMMLRSFASFRKLLFLLEGLL